MKTFLVAFLVAVLATEGVKALWCHTCVDNRPWPIINGTAAEVNGPLSLCRRDVEPSFLFLRKCLSETDVCGQLFYDGDLSGSYTRYALRGCINPLVIGLYEPEMNVCEKATIPWLIGLPFGPATIELCFCNEDKCNPILNNEQTSGKVSRKSALEASNLIKAFQR